MVLVWLQEPGTPPATLAQVRAAGLEYILWRRPGGAAGDLLEATRASVGAGLRTIVNDRLDVALAAGVPCHLRGDSLPLPLARRIAPGLALGRSVHGRDEAIRASSEGADYLVYGHVFATASKAGVPPRGVAGLAEVVRAVPVPVLAIGGVGSRNVLEVLSTGAAGVVVQSAIGGKEPARDVDEILRAAAEAGEVSRQAEERFRGVVCVCASG